MEAIRVDANLPEAAIRAYLMGPARSAAQPISVRPGIPVTVKLQINGVK